MALDPRNLIHLLAIAEHGSFNRAAGACGLSQPALSSSIAQLERKLGVAVVRRTAHGSELNEFGKILVREARTVRSLLSHAEKEIRAKRLGLDGPLRIGATPSVTLKFLPQVMNILLQRHPSVELHLVESFDDQLIPALRDGALDLVLGPVSNAVGEPTSIAEDALFEDPFSIGVGPNSDLKARTSLTLAELADCAWVLPSAGSTYRRHIEALFLAEDVRWPSNVVITSSLSLVESIITETDRVTLITSLQASRDPVGGVRSIPLRGGGKRIISIKWRRMGELSPLAKSAVGIAHEVAATFKPMESKLRSRARKR